MKSKNQVLNDLVWKLLIDLKNSVNNEKRFDIIMRRLWIIGEIKKKSDEKIIAKQRSRRQRK